MDSIDEDGLTDYRRIGSWNCHIYLPMVLSHYLENWIYIFLKLVNEKLKEKKVTPLILFRQLPVDHIEEDNFHISRCADIFEIDVLDNVVDHQVLHISLSKPLKIRYFVLNRFKKEMLELFGTKKFGPFIVKIVSPYEYNRGILTLKNGVCNKIFWALEVNDTHGKISEMTCSIDSVLRKLGLEEYYENPVCHMSFAWIWSHDESFIKSFLDECFDKAKVLFPTDEYVLINRICIKIGSYTLDINLEDPLFGQCVS